MPMRSAFEYAVIRVVPRVERGECFNVGVVLFCRARRYLNAGFDVDRGRLKAFAPYLDLDAMEEQLRLIPPICLGGASAGPIGLLPQAERFRWLVAPRSTIVQPSAVHCGLCAEPRAALDHLLLNMVSPVPASGKRIAYGSDG